MNGSHKIAPIVNGILSVVILASNIFLFLPFTIRIIKDSGGSFGYGYLALPLLIFAHLCIVAPIHVYRGKYQFRINILLVFGAAFCAWLGYTLLTS